MTIYLRRCHSREIAKAWGMQPLRFGYGYIRCRKDGTYTPLSDRTLFYDPAEVAEAIQQGTKDYHILTELQPAKA